MAVTVEEVYFEVNGSFYFREKIIEQYLAILLRHSSVNQYNKAWFCEILRDTFRHGCQCLRSSMDYLIFLITLQVCKFTSTSPTSLRKNFQLLQPLSSRPRKQRARQPISCDYSLITVEQVKYQLVYEERAVDPVTFKTYPFGYERLGNQEKINYKKFLGAWPAGFAHVPRVKYGVFEESYVVSFIFYLFIYLFILQGVKILFPLYMTSFKRELIVL